jgi:DnaK suppressor protein
LPKRTATARKTSRAAGASRTKAAKPTAKSKAAKKPAKVTKKPAPKAPAKPTAKAPKPPKVTAKAPPKAPAKPEKVEKPAPEKAVEKPVVKPSKPKEVEAPAPVAVAEAEKKIPKKNITVSEGRPARRAKAPGPQMPRLGEPLFRPGAPAPKPLIASGPKAPPPAAPLGPGTDLPIKSPLSEKQLEHYREVLLQKRVELVGDVATMENEALMSQSGALSHLPQHMAEQGSDVYGQSLSLDLAAADRRLIKEIDDALIRIQQGVYGVCELTGKPIKIERLNELPWARYSIEAARELERRGATQ